MKKYILLFYLCIHLHLLFANHLVGGGINYRHLSGNSYEVTLKILKDCDGAISSGFDGDLSSGVSLVVNIFKKTDNSLVSQISGIIPTVTTVPNFIPDSCLTPGNFCYEEGTYTFNITLPDSNETYYLTYTRCCRNKKITNIVTPLYSGASYTIEIPPTSIYQNNSCIYNSSPTFNTSILDSFIMDFSVTDFDGDSIYYNLCPALEGANYLNPYLTIGDSSNIAPYINVTYQSPYSYSNPMNGSISESIQIDHNTGIIKGFPTTHGVFLISVCASEFRFGQKVCTNRREFELVVGSGLGTVLESLDTIYICPSYEPAQLSVASYSANHNIVWFSNLDGYSNPLNGIFGTPSSTSYSVYPYVPTIYRGTSVDANTHCYSLDTVQVVVIPYSNQICDSIYYFVDDNKNQFNFDISPNPTSDILNVSISSFDKNSQLTLFDIYGNILEKVFINKNKFEFSMSNYPKGFYTLVLENNKNKTIKKAIYY